VLVRRGEVNSRGRGRIVCELFVEIGEGRARIDGARRFGRCNCVPLKLRGRCGRRSGGRVKLFRRDAVRLKQRVESRRVGGRGRELLRELLRLRGRVFGRKLPLRFALILRRALRVHHRRRRG
jgi:hypothetical protein